MPNASIRIVWTTCQVVSRRIPLNLFDVIMVLIRPDLSWTIRLVHVPQVDVFALTRDSETLGILPFKFSDCEPIINVLHIERDYIFWIFGIPNTDNARVSSRGDQVSNSFVEFRLREHELKGLYRDHWLLFFWLRPTFFDFPDSSIRVSWTCDDPITFLIPVHRAHVGHSFGVLLWRICLQVWEGVRPFKMVRVVIPEVPETGFIEVSTHKQHSLSWRERRPINISIATVGLSHEDNALFFISFEGNYWAWWIILTSFELLLIIYCLGTSLSSHWHALEMIQILLHGLISLGTLTSLELVLAVLRS